MNASQPISPVDAAAAFARLYQHWFADHRKLLLDSRSRVDSLAGSYVADVLALWDDRAKAWLPRTPTILRLESCDMAVFAMRDPFVAPYFGSIDTDSPVATFGPKAGRTRATTQAESPYWKSLRPCSYAIGRILERVEFDADADGRIRAARALLDDGGVLRMNGAGIGCASPAVPLSA